MKRIILLKTQLAEAARLANAADEAHHRLAVILLDNFIEIQLSEMMKRKFSYDDMFSSRPKKYPYAQRTKILYNYDELLKVSVAEAIISDNERLALQFCHEVRNKLYHQASEEQAVAVIALYFLHELIVKYQPLWRSGRSYTIGDIKTTDPFLAGPQSASGMRANDEKTWSDFLSHYFVFNLVQSEPAAALISGHLLSKVEQAEELFHYFRDEYTIYAPHTADWQLNEFVRYYAFFIKHDIDLDILKEQGSAAYNKGFRKLISEHHQHWTFIKLDRLKILKQKLAALRKLSSYQALEKFNSYKGEVYLIHAAMSRASGDFDQRVEEDMERLRD